VSRLKPSDVRQAQRFTQPVERISDIEPPMATLSEAELERRLEFAQDGREDAQREAADVEAEQG